MPTREGLGRLFNVAPIAAGVGLSYKQCAGYTFICTGNDTFTVTVAAGLSGSYATPGNIITRKYTNTATNGTAVWVEATQAASNAVTIASGSVAFFVGGESLPDLKTHIKVSVAAAGLVFAVAHDLVVMRNPANLAKLSV